MKKKLLKTLGVLLLFCMVFWQIKVSALAKEKTEKIRYMEENKAKSVFRRAYEKMHDWQEQIEGDLTLPVRFCDDFSYCQSAGII